MSRCDSLAAVCSPANGGLLGTQASFPCYHTLIGRGFETLPCASPNLKGAQVIYTLFVTDTCLLTTTANNDPGEHLELTELSEWSVQVNVIRIYEAPAHGRYHKEMDSFHHFLPALA